jgi:hypothetical protein
MPRITRVLLASTSTIVAICACGVSDRRFDATLWKASAPGSSTRISMAYAKLRITIPLTRRAVQAQPLERMIGCTATP